MDGSNEFPTEEELEEMMQNEEFISGNIQIQNNNNNNSDISTAASSASATAFSDRERISAILAPLTVRCERCGTDNNLDIDSKLAAEFGIHVCFTCKRNASLYATDSDIYGKITRTKAKEIYLLSDYVMDSLPFCFVKNPINPRFKGMKLYLKKHVIEKAIEKYGSMEGLEAEREKKAKNQEERMKMKRKRKDITSSKNLVQILNGNQGEVTQGGKKRASGTDVLKKEIEKLRNELDIQAEDGEYVDVSQAEPAVAIAKQVEDKSKGKSLPVLSESLLSLRKESKIHEHDFDEDKEKCIDEENGIFKNKCKICGYEIEFERI